MIMNDIEPIKYFKSVITLRTLLVSVFAFTAVSAYGQLAIAQGNPDAPGLSQAPGLFISQNVPGAQKKNEAAFRHRSVQINMDHLNNKHILLNLFDDTGFLAERTHVKRG